MGGTRRARPLAGSLHTVIVLAVLMTVASLPSLSLSGAEGETQPPDPRGGALPGSGSLTAPRIQVRTLTMDERVEAQRAIEDVYWRHRIWPKENPTPKPPLSQVMPDTAIRAKVEDYLKKSDALERFWRRPVTGRQLQAEMDRMARSTHEPETLRELYSALRDDAFLIAETLARPTLVDRLIRGWYASDDRFHGVLRREAEQELAGARGVAGMRAMSGDYLERTLVRRQGSERLSVDKPRKGVVELDAGEWEGWREEVARRFGSVPEAIPVGSLSALQQEADRFFVAAVLSFEADEAVVASVVWPKRSFDSWWSETRAEASSEVEAEEGPYKVSVSFHGPCADDTWGSASYPPPARSGHTAVWTGSEMIVWGGSDDTSNLNSGARYDPATDSWSATSTGANVPSAREDYSVVWTGTDMIIWGGYNGGPLNTGGRYDPATDTWTPTSTGANVPSERTAHTAVWTGSEMIIWGGYNRGPLNTGGRYDPAMDTWTPTPTGANTPSGRYFHTAVWTGSEMIVWGGYFNDDTGGHYLNTGARYDPSTDTWTPTSTGANVPSGRSGHTAVWTGTQMIVWSGDTGGRYDPATDTWTPTSTGANVPSWRIDHTAVWTGSEMIIWGGWATTTAFVFLTGGRYDPATDTWTPTSTGANVPSERVYHTAVWTGSEMIIWGGLVVNDSNNFSSARTGGRYDPATDSWTPTAMGDVPSARSGHRAVWTGAEMIVWGGSYFVGGPLETGGRYDPATESWILLSKGPASVSDHTVIWTGTAMIVAGGWSNYADFTISSYDPGTNNWTLTDLPIWGWSGRVYHTAVWTGTEMILWGGWSYWDNRHLDTGLRFNPSTADLSWTSKGTNVPSARSGHTAVWTGSEMIVWGGNDYTSQFNSGGRYNPSTDTWTTTSRGANVPSGRSTHTAVWTGAEMIVWGGHSNTGARYDPSTDNWTPTSTGMNVPSARDANTAIWTGTEMIIWGGIFYDGTYHSIDTGARYVPATDTWSPTSTGANVPSGRGYHTAVWTGSEMIVWGGAHDGTDLETGGRYCASGCASPTTSYRDADGDGYGTPLLSTLTCDGSVPLGYAASGTDCDDSDPAMNPLAVELPGDAVDQDCDGVLSCDPRAFYWNHGQFVRCVAQQCMNLVATGAVNQAQCEALVSRAARSDTGK